MGRVLEPFGGIPSECPPSPFTPFTAFTGHSVR